MVGSTIDSVASVAHEFEAAILDSAKSPEEARPKLTLDAVERLVSQLKEIDAEIGDDPALAQQLRVTFRAELSELCTKGPLWNRGWMKPQGYPGDFNMLESIYANRPIAGDPIGRELDRAFLESLLAKTVRSRKNLLVNHLLNVICSHSGEGCRLLDLACGPSIDVAEVLNAMNDHQHPQFVCVDQDADALACSQSHLLPLVNGNHKCLEFIRANILRLRPNESPAFGDPFDVVYSVGLLDYVPDKLASLAMRNWWRLVAPGGQLVLTIKDRDRYDPTFYDWMADWTFVPRTTRDFASLIENSLGLQVAQYSLHREDMDVSVMAVIPRQSLQVT